MLNAAIVGLGWWGKVMVEAVQGKSERLRFVRGVTKEPQEAAPFAARHGLALSTEYEDALADPQVDAVVLATPHSLHAEQIIAAVARGKQVFTEKPLTLSRADAERALDACARAGRVLGLGHNRRLWRPVMALKRMLDAGELGTPMQVEGNYSTDWLSGVKRGMWRASPDEAPVGGMTGMGIHLIDSYVHFFGPIAEVYAIPATRALDLPTGDTVSVLLRFASGMPGYLGTTMCTNYIWRIHVFGSAGWAETRSETNLTVHLRGREPVTTEDGPYDTVRENLEAWADATRGLRAYIHRPDEMLHVVAVLEAVFRSARTGRPVSVG